MPCLVCSQPGTKYCGSCAKENYWNCYCSTECQMKHWKESHKKKCRSKSTYEFTFLNATISDNRGSAKRLFLEVALSKEEHNLAARNPPESGEVMYEIVTHSTQQEKFLALENWKCYNWSSNKEEDCSNPVTGV